MAEKTKITHEMALTDSTGKLIYAEKSRLFDLLCRYDAWRSKICSKYRKKNLWLSFRQGKLNPLTLIYSLYILIKEECNGTNRKSHN